MEWNYYFFRNDSGAYALSQYPGCCTGMGDFERLLRHLFNQFKQALEISEQEQSKSAKPVKKRGRPAFSRLASEESWQEQAKHLSRIDALTMTDVADDQFTIEVLGAADQLDSKQLRSRSITYRFEPQSAKNKLLPRSLNIGHFYPAAYCTGSAWK